MADSQTNKIQIKNKQQQKGDNHDYYKWKTPTQNETCKQQKWKLYSKKKDVWTNKRGWRRFVESVMKQWMKHHKCKHKKLSTMNIGVENLQRLSWNNQQSTTKCNNRWFSKNVMK